MARRICSALVAGTLILAPAALHAQSQGSETTAESESAGGSWQGPPQAEAWFEEVRLLQQRMQPLQREAMQDTSLRRMQREATSALTQAMRQHDPEILDKLARIGAILEEAAVARAADDQQKLAELSAEARELQPAIAAAQTQALNDPDVTQRLAAFQQQLHAAMLSIDPSAAQAIQRLGELEQNLRGVQLEPYI